MENKEIKKKEFGIGKFLIYAIIYAVIYTAVFFYYKESAIKSALISSSNIADIFNTYAVFFGIAIGLLYFLKSLILILIKKLLFLGKFYIGNFIVSLIVSGSLGYFAYFLVYFEPRYTEIARGIIDYIGRPLLYSSVVIFVLTCVCMTVTIIKNSKKA